MIPRSWLKSREAYLESVGKGDEFNRRILQLVSEGVDFEERQEIADREFGITWQVLEPFRAKLEKAKSRPRKGSPESPPVPAPEAAAPAAGSESADGVPEEIGGDVADVRWALANLSRAGVGPRDAPTAIAWNLLVIGRSGIQGQLKLMDIYRATIVQPAAKAAENAVAGGPDVRLDELLARLGEGLGGSQEPA